MVSRLPSLRVRLAALLLPLVPMLPLHAQVTGYPPLIDADPVAALSRYLRMLAANPRDLSSLTGAGRAALAVGDANAALGFYARAEEIAPRNGRIKAGLAAALVQMEQPRAALKLFDEAVALGVPMGDIASDRGLANDLNGDGRRAQADYTLALRGRDDDETVRRLALSMAVSGDRAGALTMLEPLLRRRDSGAIRARAFVLALTGDQAGAASAVRSAMPGPQATAMANFLGRLGTLNPAQKALAVNFGYFPSDGRSYGAAELFADSRLPSAPATALRGPRSDAPLVPAGEPLGPRFATAAESADARAPRRRPGQIETVIEIPPPPHVLRAPMPGPAAAVRTAAHSVIQPKPAAVPPAAEIAAIESPVAVRTTVRPVVQLKPAAVTRPAEITAVAARSTGVPAAAARAGGAVPPARGSGGSAMPVTVTTSGATPGTLVPPPEVTAASGVPAPQVSVASSSVAPVSVVALSDRSAAIGAEATGSGAVAPPAVTGAAAGGLVAPGRPGGGAVIVSAVGPALATNEAVAPAFTPAPATGPAVTGTPPSADPPPLTHAAAAVAPAGTTPAPAPARAAPAGAPRPVATRLAGLDAKALLPKAAVSATAGHGGTSIEPARAGTAKTPAATGEARAPASKHGGRTREAEDRADDKAAKAAKAGVGKGDAADSKDAKAKGATTNAVDKAEANAKGSKAKPDTKLAASEKTVRGKAGKKDALDGTKDAGDDVPTKRKGTGKETADRTKGTGKGASGQTKTAGKDAAGKDAADKTKAAEKIKTADKTKAAAAKLPERYWVQVASGANKANLDKAWTSVKGKAPKLLQGQATYTAPWRASNRLLIGPYKTEEEAQAQVNKLAKSGVSGIQFTTRAGADVEKVAK